VRKTESARITREDRKLARLTRTHPDRVSLSDRVAGTTSESAELFDSDYKPASEWAEDPRQDWRCRPTRGQVR
jgi:hypothetical protein